ncbi:sensor histidine kinase [Paenibacillus eucommiae]|uniref:Two-component system sensor histidine kinase YesM n=1 Tax=Paenibacillus eucommiae TaxID=1355755 RepID=A0ABS4ITY9_9BACL|nr:histidine kinase [Paenibacillus eucommiae]MBP1991047.1 two-component system sensor histidine kinase YesM [Paenibacillus eucommiae]
MRYLRNPNIFLRVVFLLLIIIIPIYLLVFVIIHTSGIILHKEIAGSMESRINSYSELLDSEINHVAKLKTEYLYDEDLQMLSTVSITLTNYERLSALNRLSRKLQLFKDSSRIVENVQVYIPNIQKTIGIMSYSAPMSEEEMAMIREVNTDHSPKIISWHDQLIMALYDPPNSGARTNFYFKIELSPSLLIDSLMKITAKEDGRFYLMDKAGSWLLSNASASEQKSQHTIQAFLSNSSQSRISGFGNLNLDNDNYFGAYSSSNYSNTTLLVAVPDRQVFGLLHRYSQLFWILFAISIALVFAYSQRIYLLIHRPLQVMVRALRKVEDGDYNIYLRHSKQDEFQYVYGQFNMMVSRLRELIHEVYEQRIHTQQAELKQLQSQINPHFLYNTMFVLHRMAASYGLTDVTRFTDYLGKYFLFLTRTGSSEICLLDEWNHAIIYTEIQKIRFSDRIEVIWPELPDSFQTVRVPRMIIQPLLENAYKYALEKKLRKGILRVTAAAADDGCLRIHIEDNGEYLEEQTLQRLVSSLDEGAMNQETTGLVNVHRRLQLYFAAGAGLSFDRSEWNGLKITIQIPHREEKEHEHKHVPSVDCG